MGMEKYSFLVCYEQDIKFAQLVHLFELKRI